MRGLGSLFGIPQPSYEGLGSFGPQRQPLGLALPPGTKLDREMSYDGSHPRQQEQAARDHFRSYGPQTLADAFIPGYGAGGDAKAASEAYGEGRYGAAALNAGMAAADFLPFLSVLPAAAKGIRAFHGGGGDVAKAAGDRGAWFSEARDLADEYAFGGGSVREAEITPTKPISFVHAEQRRPIGDLISTALEGAGDLSDEAISRARPIIDRLNARYAGENNPLFEYWNNDRDVADLFRALGYDSISVAEKSGGPKTWAALDPAIISSPATKGIRAFHGSPHDFDRFDMSKIGTGEGAQAYGRGLYFAEGENIAKYYRDYLSGFDLKWPSKKVEDAFNGLPSRYRQNIETQLLSGEKSPKEIRETLGHMVDAARRRQGTRYAEDGDDALIAAGEQLLAAKSLAKPVSRGRLYEVNIDADPEAFLDYDRDLLSQGSSAREALERLGYKADPEGLRRYDDALLDALLGDGPAALPSQPRNPTGSDILTAVGESRLRDAGIPGIKYLDAGSRGAGDGSRNYVVFDDRLITILRKYGIGALIAGGAGYGLTQAEYAQAAELLAQDGMNTGAQ